MADARAANGRRLLRWAAAFGPGLIVMLADSDAGSIITAAQSGVAWKYSLILPQVLLIPVLYVVQEITVRLGAVTGKGHAQLIRDHFGPVWSYFSVGTLFVTGIGALVTEYVGIAEAGSLFGVPPFVTVPLSALILTFIVMTGSYRRVERIGILVGLLELLFVVAALLAHPDWRAVARQASQMPLGDPRYRFMLGANIGAVIMPWMIFYQQRAVADKGLTSNDIRSGRIDTLVGAVTTQVVMIMVIVAMAATHAGPTAKNITSLQEIVQALQSVVGRTAGMYIAALGMVGASFTAAIVVSLASAWSVGEVFGPNQGEGRPLGGTRGFRIAFVAANACGAGIVLSGVSVLGMTLDIEVMNALLLPLVLGFLLAIEARSLPRKYRMRGLYRVVALSVSGLVIAGGLFLAWDVLPR